jgi:hypothetical protein
VWHARSGSGSGYWLLGASAWLVASG